MTEVLEPYQKLFSFSLSWTLLFIVGVFVILFSLWRVLKESNCKWRLLSIETKRKKSNTKNFAEDLTQDLPSIRIDIIKALIQYFTQKKMKLLL